MNDVAFRVEQNVAVMSVLDLEQVADQRVAGAREDEVVHRRHVAFGSGGAELFDEVSLQSAGLHLLDLVDTGRVDDRLQNARVGPSNEDLVRPDPDLRHFFVPSRLQRRHQLVGEHLLAQVVTALDDDGQQLPVLEVAIGRSFADLALFLGERLFQRRGGGIIWVNSKQSLLRIRFFTFNHRSVSDWKILF